MSEHDQSGSHYPDKDHLHRWSTDAFGDGPRQPRGRGRSSGLVTKLLVVVVCLTALAYLITGIESNRLQIREAQERQAGMNREKEIQRKVKEMREQEKNAPPINYFSDDFRTRRQP